MNVSDPVVQVGIAATCAAVLCCIMFVLARRVGRKRLTTWRALSLGTFVMAVVSISCAVQASHLATEIDDGDYALLRIAMPVDPRLMPVVSSAMRDGRITYGEYEPMKFKGAIPDRKVMRTIVAQDVAEMQP